MSTRDIKNFFIRFRQTPDQWISFWIGFGEGICPVTPKLKIGASDALDSITRAYALYSIGRALGFACLIVLATLCIMSIVSVGR